MTRWKMINYQCIHPVQPQLRLRWMRRGGRRVRDENNSDITFKPRKKNLTEIVLTPDDDAGGQVGRVWCVCPSSAPKNRQSPLLPPSNPPSHRDYINRFTHICQLSITNV